MVSEVKPINLQIPPPEAVNIQENALENWKYFMAHWENYSIATGLDKQEDTMKVATLLAVIGKDVYNIYLHLNLNEREKRDPKKIMQAITNYFAPKVNVIFERSIFNQANQHEGENVEQASNAELPPSATPSSPVKM